jgi:hypothetical protein
MRKNFGAFLSFLAVLCGALSFEFLSNPNIPKDNSGK